MRPSLTIPSVCTCETYLTHCRRAVPSARSRWLSRYRTSAGILNTHKCMRRIKSVIATAGGAMSGPKCSLCLGLTATRCDARTCITVPTNLAGQRRGVRPLTGSNSLWVKLVGAGLQTPYRSVQDCSPEYRMRRSAEIWLDRRRVGDASERKIRGSPKRLLD